MAKKLVTDELWEVIEPLLPEEAPCLPKAYDFPRCREALRKSGITPRIARRGIESSEKLGRYRWVAEIV